MPDYRSLTSTGDDASTNATRTPSTRLIHCPNCDIPTGISPPVNFIVFPDDIDLIEKTLSATLNTHEHFCGARFVELTQVLLLAPSKKRAISVLNPTDPPSLIPPDWDRTTVADYSELQRVVTSWLEEESRELSEIVSGNWLSLNQRARIAAATPIRLLSWAIDLQHAPQEGCDVDELDVRTRLYADVATTKLHDLADQATSDGAAPDLMAIIAASIPRRGLTSTVLHALASSCDDDFIANLEDRDRTGTAFRREWTCAAAHAVAGEPNHRQDAWAAMLTHLWRLDRRTNAPTDRGFFLTPEALQATLPFEALLSSVLSFESPDNSFTFDSLEVILRDYAELFDLAGYGARFLEWFNLLLARGLAVAAPRITVADMFEHSASLAGSAPETTLGRMTSQGARQWAMTFPDRRDEIVLGFARAVAETSPFDELCRFVDGCTQWLNELHETNLAQHLIELVIDGIVDDRDTLNAGELASLWNEIGNTFRYMGQPEESLTAYEIATDYSRGLADENNRLRVVARNRAIVLRDSGNFADAEAHFRRLISENPREPDLFHSMAVFYDRIGEPQKGLEAINEALSFPQLRQYQIRQYLIARADFHRELRDDEAALSDVQLAWTLRARDAIDDGLRLAAVAVRCETSDPQRREFQEELVDFVFEHAPVLVRFNAGAAVAALTHVAYVALGEGDTVRARRALEFALPEPRSPESTQAGEVAVAWAWLEALEGHPTDGLPWLLDGLQSLEQNVPEGREENYAFTWVRSQNAITDRVLELAPRMTSDPSTLIAVYEAANGRELGGQAPTDGISDWGVLLSSAAHRSRSDIAILLDGTESLTVLFIPATGAGPHVQTIDISAAELEGATRQLAKFDTANPLAPHRIDTKLSNWWHVAGTIADAIRPFLTEGAELTFLPGRRLTSTPLHLAGWPSSPLLLDRPVSVCPNARVLLASGDSSGGPTGIVVVPKARDADDFMTALHRAAERIRDRADDPHLLTDERADSASVLALAAKAGEIVFLCHGVSSSGHGQGPGICVAAEGLLPSSPLPIEADPNLGRFALSWSDLVQAPSTPHIVVSMACSTGRSQVGSGGVRIGLEQGLLRRGTSAIISPLWNIDQESSLAWLDAFYANHRPGTADDLSSAYRLACLETRKRYPHPFAWGPFVLTRRLAKEHP